MCVSQGAPGVKFSVKVHATRGKLKCRKKVSLLAERFTWGFVYKRGEKPVCEMKQLYCSQNLHS